MTLLFDGKGTLKVRNKGFLSFLNKTTSRDFHESLPLGAGSEVDKPIPTPFGVPVIAYAKYESGAIDAGIKVLGMVTLPLFHKNVAKVGDQVPIKWSAFGCTLEGTVTVQ